MLQGNDIFYLYWSCLAII